MFSSTRHNSFHFYFIYYKLPNTILLLFFKKVLFTANMQFSIAIATLAAVAAAAPNANQAAATRQANLEQLKNQAAAIHADAAAAGCDFASMYSALKLSSYPLANMLQSAFLPLLVRPLLAVLLLPRLVLVRTSPSPKPWPDESIADWFHSLDILADLACIASVGNAIVSSAFYM